MSRPTFIPVADCRSCPVKTTSSMALDCHACQERTRARLRIEEDRLARAMRLDDLYRAADEADRVAEAAWIAEHGEPTDEERA